MYACTVQEKRLVSSVMLAHCISSKIPIAKLPDYGLMPADEKWTLHVYAWQDAYVDKIRKDLVAAGLWDSPAVLLHSVQLYV